MSYPAASVAGVFHPWRYLRDTHPGVLVWHTKTLPPAILGVTDGQDVWLDADMTQAERRCTLVHETIHIERGHRGCQPPAVEASVEREAARRLIPVQALGEALAWARSEAEAAEELWVDVATLRVRLASLNHFERGYLRRRLEE